MIVFNNWQISVTGLIARQYDNLSRSIDVEGDLPAGYTWQLLVQCGGNADTILLEATETGAGALLTADNLSKAGEYYIQLRGVLEADGVTKRHTNVVSAYIPESLTGLGTWPKVPTEFAQVEARILELYQHPPIPGSNGYWLVWDTDKDEYVESQLSLPAAAAGGTSDHSKLANRDAADQHPMSAITGLENALEGKQPVGSYITEESDPTVPEWAKQPQKPVYTAQEVGALPDTTHIPSTAADVNAEPSGAVSQHNVSDVAHNDIRLLIQGLSERLSAVADSDDTTLDQLSEIVAYIKSNKNLIDAITTSKVNVADIVDNLTTNVANKPLSAAQGVALKALIDTLTEAMPEAYTLPIASSTQLGGVQPAAKTDAMTQAVGVDEAGVLWTAAGGADKWELITELTVEEEIHKIVFNEFSLKKCLICTKIIGTATNTVNTNGSLNVNGEKYFLSNVMASGAGITRYIVSYLEVCGGVKRHVSSKHNNNWQQVNGLEHGIVGDGSPISEISFVQISTNMFGVGTTIQIYGVRT